MDKELLSDIRSWQRKLPEITELGQEESQLIIDYVAQNFVSDRRKLWWWDSLSIKSNTIDYGDGDALEILKSNLEPTDVVYLIVTDDEHEPWPVFKGRLEQLLVLVGEQRYFEFIIVDKRRGFCVFDTHHNTLVYAGADAAAFFAS